MEYECWKLSEGQGESELITARSFKAAAEIWCTHNWSTYMDGDDDSESLEVAVLSEETGEKKIFSVDRAVEYTAIENKE